VTPWDRGGGASFATNGRRLKLDAMQSQDKAKIQRMRINEKPRFELTRRGLIFSLG